MTNKNLDVFTLTEEQRNYLFASKNKKEKSARANTLKMELMGVSLPDERAVTEQAAKHAINVSGRVRKPKAYFERWRGFANEFDMLYKILVYNDINNNYYSMLQSQVNNNPNKSTIEIHRLDGDGFYELGNIYPLLEDDHTWAHGTEIKIFYVEDDKIYPKTYSSLTKFYKETEVSKVQLTQALTTNNQIEINGKQHHIKMVNHKITTDIPYVIESYKKIIEKLKSPEAIEPYQKEMQEYEQILAHATAHNKRMEQFKGIEVYDIWNETATKLKQSSQMERSGILKTLIDEFTARDAIKFELDELHNDTNLVLLELERMQSLEYLKYEQVNNKVRIYDVQRNKLQSNKYRFKS